MPLDTEQRRWIIFCKQLFFWLPSLPSFSSDVRLSSQSNSRCRPLTVTQSHSVRPNTVTTVSAHYRPLPLSSFFPSFFLIQLLQITLALLATHKAATLCVCQFFSPIEFSVLYFFILIW